MARLFSSFRVAPGLRISTSSRGVRAHVGPRLLRAHVGGGRSGVSTGAGPFTAYQSVSGGAGKGSDASATPQQRHEAARRALARIDRLHLGTVAVVERPLAAPVRLPRFLTLVGAAEKQFLRGVRRFDRAARKAARLQAHGQAEAWARDLMAIAARETAERQASLDAGWNALVANDPAAVIRALRESLSASGAPARATYVGDGVAGLVVTGPLLEELPSEKPWTTAAGAPTAARMNKTDLATVTQKVIAARVILVVRQCFAAAPGLTGIAVVVVDPANGQPRVAANFERQRFERSSQGAEPSATLLACASELVSKPSGRTGELGVIKLASGSTYAGVMSSAGG